MGDDQTVLLDRIRALIEEKSAAPERLLGSMENTLTDGYAQALALEGEAMRVEKEIAAALSRATEVQDVRTLRALVDRLSSTRLEIARLRELLGILSRRVDAVRAAATRAAG